MSEIASKKLDTDDDGTPDYKDFDSDGDGLPDEVEARNGGDPCKEPVNTDNDLRPDFIDRDSDDPLDHTLGDAEEAGGNFKHPTDTDNDGLPDYADNDNDGDGAKDEFELTPTGIGAPVVAASQAPDTDLDGTPDHLDPDSDEDSVEDGIDGVIDTDGDGLANFRDLDSDGDAVPDKAEVVDPRRPVDSDGDEAPDFEDTDSDNDGLVDGSEDKNHDGVLQVEGCETDRLRDDTDGDSVGDLIEFAACDVKPIDQQVLFACDCDGSDRAKSPLTRGDFVFVSDYEKDPVPKVETLDLSTDVSQADVIFSLDTTGSMRACLTNLASSLANLVVPKTQAKVRNIAFGVLEFRDMTDMYAVRYDHRVQTVFTKDGILSIQNALRALMAAGGGDGPEAGWQALYSIAGGPQVKVGVYDSKLNLAATPPLMAVKGEKFGDQHGAGFRKGTVPIVVTVTDVEWHDATGSLNMNDPESGLNAYIQQYMGTPSRRDTIKRLQGIGAKVIGLAALSGGARSGKPRDRALAVASETGATVRPGHFGVVGRPAGCAQNECCTGPNGEGEMPINGMCPLAYTVDRETGQGVSESVVSGIVALASGLFFDIHALASDVDAGAVDNFIERLEPNLSGEGMAQLCLRMPPMPLEDNFTGPNATPGADGIYDTFPGIGGGQLICFDVIPKINKRVIPTEKPQMFRAQIIVQGNNNGNVVNLGYARDVFFLVPPKIKNGPIG